MNKNKLVLIGSNLVTVLLCWVGFTHSTYYVPGGQGQRSSEGNSAGEESLGDQSSTAHRRKAIQSNGLSDAYNPTPVNNTVAPYPYISQSGGNLSSQLIKDCDLTKEQFDQAQAAFSNYWNQMSQKIGARITFDKTASDDDPEGAKIYRLPSLPLSERQSMALELRNKLNDIKGGGLSEKVLNGLKDSLSFGKQGSCDVVFRLTPQREITLDHDRNIVKEEFSKDEYTVNYSYINPRTGDEEVNGIDDAASVTKDFGYVFALPGKQK